MTTQSTDLYESYNELNAHMRETILKKLEGINNLVTEYYSDLKEAEKNMWLYEIPIDEKAFKSRRESILLQINEFYLSNLK